MTVVEITDANYTWRLRRKWLQFSISTLLLVMTMLAAGLGFARYRAESQRRAVAAIRELGASVRYDYEPADGSQAELPGPDWLCRMLGVDYFADVVEVQIPATCRIDDQGCSHLGVLTSLRSLSLTGSDVTDAGLAHLASLTDLKELHLGWNWRVTSEGLVHLAALVNLRALHLREVSIGDDGLAHLAGLTNLRTLDLANAQINDRISKKGLRHLSGMTRLEWLDLTFCQVTDAALPQLSRCRNLRWLNLGCTEVTDGGIPHLTKFRKLRHLELGGTHVTFEGYSKFNEALPYCRVPSFQPPRLEFLRSLEPALRREAM